MEPLPAAGLGLAIPKRIVETHTGTIGVWNDDPGPGAHGHGRIAAASAGVAHTPRDPDRRRLPGMATFLAGLAFASAISPLTSLAVPSLVGGLLLVAALTEALHGTRRPTIAEQRKAWGSAGVTLGLGMVLLAAPFFAGAALVTLVAGWLALEAGRRLVEAWRVRASRREAGLAVLAAGANLLVALLIVTLREAALDWLVAAAGAMRLGETALDIATAPPSAATEDTVLDDIGLAPHPAMVERAHELADAEHARAGIDAGWLVAFALTLFAIHVGRMGFDKSALGVLSPFVAVMGDLVIALLVAFAVVIPSRLAFRRLTRVLERTAWTWVLSPPPARRLSAWIRSLVRTWLDGRLRFSIRLRSARHSIPMALSRGLQAGLPLAAILAATIPMWGMSWYFDTENWAAGVWNSWAESRTDTWREAMVQAVVDGGLASLDARGFTVHPGGVDGDFSFIVIGDTGEGDASQHVLRDSLIRAAGQERVRFVVLSSDVVYPTGAMKHYEPRFWLPFKGIDKPVYAIPGNHDWYDALEGFAATFFTPEAARAAMRARVDTDNNVSSTTDARVDELVRQAASLRASYRVPTGFQQAPFFQVQTPRFALIAVDTGVLKRVDVHQMAWLRASLQASRGKTVMVVLGHPFYAGGHRQWEGSDGFAELKALLDQHGASIVMAGDTHDLEYYAEPLSSAPESQDLRDARAPAGQPRVHHFVNGGGGAYLSFGTALAWPLEPAVDRWAYYPSTAAVTAKIASATPYWKWPAWWWTREFGAWPFSAEWLSAAFDYNTAPFFQSFVEVRVEALAGRVRIVPWGIYGPLSRRDFQMPAASRDAGETGDAATMEWVIDMRK